MKNGESFGIDQTICALQQAIESKGTQMRQTRVPSGLSPMVSRLFSEVLDKARGPHVPVSQVLEHGGAFAQNFIKKLQDRPWEVLGQVAVYSFGIGLFFSLRHQRSPTGKKE